MEALFTPWRAAYLAGGGVDPGGCLFCELPKHDDAEALLVTRGRLAYAVLNRYPYANGHVMIAPFAHRSGLAEMTADERHEVVDLAARFETILRETYRPHGFNAGLNLGRSAGAGVEHHAHVHIVPRWDGDTNFLTVLGGTRTIPEDLPTTRGRLAAAFARAS
jgi:ATP adenylyltransferase